MLDCHLIIVIVLLVLNILNAVLHSVGTYLLVCLYRNGNDSTQMIYLINLGLCEALMNFLEAFRSISALISQEYTMERIREYILIVMFTGISFVFYLNMSYITLDKLFDLLLNIRFSLYWSTKRAKRLLQGTWVVGLSLSILVALLHRFNGLDWTEPFFKYFYPIVGFSFIAIAFVTYGFLFYKFKVTREVPAAVGQQRSGARRRSSVYQVFRRSRFYIPVWLISTFIVFMLVPDMTYLFVGIILNQPSDALFFGCWISYALANLIDAWIYIYIQPAVRKLLLKKLRWRNRGSQRSSKASVYTIS